MSKKYNISYSTDVLKRMMDEKALDEFHELYQNARKYSRREKTVSDTDLKYLEMFQAGKNFCQIAREANITEARVRNAIMWAALSRA